MEETQAWLGEVLASGVEHIFRKKNENKWNIALGPWLRICICYAYYARRSGSYWHMW